MEPSTDRVSVVVSPPRIDLTLFESFDEEVERTVDEILSDPSVESNFDDYSHGGDGSHDARSATGLEEHERPMKRSKKRHQHRSPYFSTAVKGVPKGPVARRNITRMSSAEAEEEEEAELEEEGDESEEVEEIQGRGQARSNKHKPHSEESSSPDIIEVRSTTTKQPQPQAPDNADEDDYVLETLEESQRNRLVAFITSHPFVTNPKYRAKRKKWRRFVADLRREAGLANVDKPTIRRLENYVKGICRDMHQAAMMENEASTDGDGDGGREKSPKKSKAKRDREDSTHGKASSKAKRDREDDDPGKKAKKDDGPRKKAKRDDNPRKKVNRAKKSSSTPATASEKRNKPEPEVINLDSDDEPVVVSTSSSSRSPDINVGYRPIVRRAVSRQPTSESAYGDVDEEPEESPKNSNPVINDKPTRVPPPTPFKIYEPGNDGNATSPTHASTRSSDHSTSLARHSHRKEEERERRRTRRRNRRQKSTKSRKYRDSLTSQRSEKESQQNPGVSPETQPLLRTPEKQLNRTALRPDPDTPVMEDPYWDMDF